MERNYKLVKVKVSDLKISPSNVRKTVDEHELETLTDSVYFSGGPLVPVVINQNNEVVAGKRRYLASKKANIEEIWALQATYPDRKEEIYDSFIENITRDPLYELDRGLAVLALREKGETIESISKRTGRATSSLQGMQIVVSLPRYIEEKTEQEAGTPEEREERRIATEVAETLRDKATWRKRRLKNQAARIFGDDLHGLLKFLKWMDEATYDEIEQRLKELKKGMKINYEREKRIRKLPISKKVYFQQIMEPFLWNKLARRCREDEEDIHNVTERFWKLWADRKITV